MGGWVCLASSWGTPANGWEHHSVGGCSGVQDGRLPGRKGKAQGASRSGLGLEPGAGP